MDLYFGKVDGSKIILDEEEIRHLKVVRANVGEIIRVTDGHGGFYGAKIVAIGKHDVELSLEGEEKFKENGPFLHLAIAPTKNIDRIEWLVEKCVELGVRKISFVRCRHSERKEVKTERLKRIAISAMKQSQKYFLPEICEMSSYDDFIKNLKETQRLICSMEARPADHIKHLLSKEDCVIMIGPEGDFHPDELQLAKQNGFKAVSLGPERLRTETAAMAACVYFNFNKHE